MKTTNTKNKFIISPKYEEYRKEIEDMITNFEDNNQYIAKGTRNSIKWQELSNGQKVSIKSFKKPNVINKYVYKYFRKSKARRSFEHGTILINKEIKTPYPIAYLEEHGSYSLKKSYFISEYIESAIEFRDINNCEDLRLRDIVLEEFTEFCYNLHEKGIDFLDHSPGNTLIKRIGDSDKFNFYLVDINRMKFREDMSMKYRMRNLARLTTDISDVEKIAKHYSDLAGAIPQQLFYTLWLEVIKFQYRFYRKKDIKLRLKSLRK